MGFLPTNTVLTQTDEFNDVSHSITYTDSLGVSHPVIITPVEINTTINVSGNKITGYFSESFYNTIYYRNKDDTFTTVHKFSDVNENEISELIHYFADTTTDKTYEYIAYVPTVDQVKSYQIVVTNNWSAGGVNVKHWVELTSPAFIVQWINDNNQTVTWINNVGKTTSWKE